MQGMNIPSFWVKGCCEIAGMRFRLHGSSQQSMDVARARMAARETLHRRFHEGKDLTLEAYRASLTELLQQEKGHAYEVEIYEPVLDRQGDANAITRNRYGAEVLNTTELCFVDVDDFPPTLGERIRTWFGGNMRTDEQRLLAALEDLRCCYGADSRLYRTAEGWRVIVACEGLAPTSAKMADIFAFLHADPLYSALCAWQQCWRARLTPKPGRLGARLGRYPRRQSSETPAEGEAAWLAAYEAASEGYAVCRLVESFGKPLTHPLVAWHDERTRAREDGLPLA